MTIEPTTSETPAPAPTPTSMSDTLYPVADPAPAPASSDVAPVDPASAVVANPAPPEPNPIPDVAPPAFTVATYESLALPETVKFSPTLLTEFKTLSAESSLPPEVAQKYADLYVKSLAEAQSAQVAEWNTTQTSWADAINSMPEFQGDAARKSKAVLGGLIDEFGSPEVRQFFSMTGDNPAVVKMLLNIAKTFSEASPTPAGNPTGDSGKAKNRSLGERLGYVN